METLRTPSPTTFRTVKWLVGSYAVLSTLAMIFAVAAPRFSTPQAEVRAVIVAVTSFLTVLFAARAARGNARALLRLRIIVPIILVAIAAVLAFLPLPGWMVTEQVVCALLLLPVAVLILRTPQR